MDHEVMDAETVAGLLGVSTRQLRNYCNLGCPFDERDRKRIFNWPAVLAWYVAFKSGGTPASDAPLVEVEEEAPPPRNETQQQANLRKTKAEANLRELDLSRKRSEVIAIADAKVRLDTMMGNMRAKLLALPPKLASRLEGEKERTGRESAIREELETLCREISTGAVVDVTEPDEPEEGEVDEISAAAAEPLPPFTDQDFGFA